MDDSVSITLLRHGMTIENEQKKYLGWNDCSLSKRGIAELKRLTTKSYPDPDLLITSDLKRCTETAQILFSNKQYVTSSLFREYHFGDWDGKTYEQLKDDRHYRKWLRNPDKITPPNGESYIAFQGRILHGWQQILHYLLNDKIKQIVIIAHGGVVRLILHHYTREEKNFWEWSTPFGQGYMLSGRREEIRRGERCTSLQVVPSTENYNG